MWHVSEAPVIRSGPWYPDEVDINAGGKATLNCAARGHPQPSISWTREDGRLIHLDHGRGHTHVHIVTL